MNLPRLAVDRPVTTLMVLLCVLVIGGLAVARLPLAFLPSVDAPFIGVIVPYPNSNPTQIEKEIAKPVEEVLSTLSGVKKLSSNSEADSAQIFMEFNWGQDLDVVRMQVSEKMDQVRGSLPEGIGEIQIFSFNTNDIPVIEGRISAEGVDLSQNYDLIEARILNRIRRVPGVARATIEGVAPREISIDLILDKIREHNVDVGALIAKLQGATSNMVLGQINHGGLRFSARALGAFESVDALRNLPVNETGLKLADIAEITYEEPPIPHGRHLDRQYAVALSVFKESTANTVDVVRAVQKVIHDDIDNDPLLIGVNLFIFQDQAEAISGGIRGLRNTGAIGAVLAIFVLYFFLRRIDSTLIVSFSIPFSVIAACGILYFMGKSLNILSMMGLMLGVGMLVDNAIVVLESIDRKHRTEPDTKKAALTGARSVSMAVASSTLTTIIVFLPLVVGSGTELTVWLGEIGLTISVALACSLFSSLTLIPLMSAHLLRRKESEPPRTIAWLENRYASALGWTLRHRVWTFVFVSVVLVIGFVPFAAGLVEQGMFSGTVNERLFLSYDFSEHTYKSEAERIVNQVETFFEPRKAEFMIDSIYSFYTENRAESTLILARKDLSDRELKELRQKIRKELPEIGGVRLYFHEDADQGGSSTFFAVKFFGQDSTILRRLAEEAERRIGTIEGIEDMSTSFKRGRKEIQVTIDRDKAQRAGLSAQDVSQIFAFTLGGFRLQRFNDGEREVETWLALRLEDRENLEDLKNLQIGGNGIDGGRPVKLGDIAYFQVVRRPQEIQRENRKIRAAVFATYEGDKWPEVQQEITKLMNAFEMPAGYSWSWNDRIVEQGQENAQMGINFLLALILVYIVMASLFESLTQPFAILCTIPFSIVGASWMLTVLRTPFNLMAQIGLLILVGIVVNNGIVLLDHLNQLRRAGMPRDEAIMQAGRDRLRPILMTATTTVVGLIPLAFGSSRVGGVYYFPLAQTVMGGLISSSVLTLLVLPYIAVGVEGFANWLGRIWRGATRVPATVPAPRPIGATPLPAASPRGSLPTS